MKIIDLTGKRFGRFVVLERVADRSRQPQWLCRCDCGRCVTVQGQSLRNGASRSCGCLRGEQVAARSLIHGHAGRRDRRPEYVVWKSIVQRCTNPHAPAYPNYGGRGIRICDQWRHSFQAFIDDMGPRPEGHTVERVDNDGDYDPANCVWATRAQQSRNKRDNKRLSFAGVDMIVADWAHLCGILPSTLRGRLASGWDPKRALGLSEDDVRGILRQRGIDVPGKGEAA